MVASVSEHHNIMLHVAKADLQAQALFSQCQTLGCRTGVKLCRRISLTLTDSIPHQVARWQKFADVAIWRLNFLCLHGEEKDCGLNREAICPSQTMPLPPYLVIWDDGLKPLPLLRNLQHPLAVSSHTG